MIKIAHVREVTGLCLPQEVVTVVKEAVTVLDTEYGEDRTADSDYGGYVLFIEDDGELEQLKELYIDLETVIPEYVNVITCDDGQIYTNCLIMLGSDFGVIMIMPLEMLSENLRKHMNL